MTTDIAPPLAPPVENRFAHMSDHALADMIGDLHVEAQRKASLMADAKAEMERRHRLSLVGLRFDVSKGDESISRLDAKGLKAKFGEAWYKGWCKPGTRTKWTITPKPLEELGVPA